LHRADIQTSKTIIAVNKDFGAVGGLCTVVPQLRDEIAERKV